MATLGLFGKLPAVGDFVSRGFSNELQGALDSLLQSALMSSYAEGANRESLEASSLPVVINIRPGSLGKNGFMGCIVPSCDRVGRFFPLCVGLETDPRPSGPMGLSPLSWVSLSLGSQLCQLALEAQTQGAGPDELLARIPAPAVFDRLAATDRPFSTTLDLTVPAFPVSTSQFAFQGPESRMALPELAMCTRLPLMVEALGGVITVGTHFDLFFATRSLLTWSSFAALFDGRWQHWGWRLQALRQDEDDLDVITLPPPDADATRVLPSSED